ncbi:MAG: pyroglutamyl-peptidase I [Tenericutes bacterium HGW-Tenericutes-3]|nr:MAG: pyroglutamyl-peptidase I [Tenericutes bacterium HGW-Tenericutes-3]
MKKILLTGFSPFNDEKINPSYEAIKYLPKKIGESNLTVIELPTEFNQSFENLKDKIIEIQPNVIIMFGQAGGRKSISLERIAINIDDASIPDNNNYQPVDQVINSSGPAAYFSTLPIRKIFNHLNQKNIPVSISNSAGTYVCNHLMYHTLDFIAQNNLIQKVGFIHVPYIHEQALEKKDVFSMSLSEITHAIETIITLLDKEDL